ncbi:MAG: hypothetical protein OXH67_04155 [Acidimicrobiaceae bacterium]|nr:hypothetical protein [Acidimicrobiaceae bacterium]MDE0664765.1 hypothetical protein [Acidimicrobiaceae bacterium]
MIPIGMIGSGGVARHAARLLLNHRSGYELVGVCSADPDAIGGDMAEIAGVASDKPIPVVGALPELLAMAPMAVIDGSRSFLHLIVDDVVACVEAGVNFVSACEELAHREPGREADWDRIDEAARRGGASVLGTGVNPGFIFDFLVLAASGLCWDIGKINGRRVVDVSGFGRNIHRRLGIGYTLDEFNAGHAEGSIAGHVGFPESIRMVVEGLGLELDGPVTQEFIPYVATDDAPTLYGAVPAGSTEGFLHTARGRVNGAEFMTLDLLLHLRPTEAGHEVGDSVDIEGEHPIHMRFRPGNDALYATSAHLVNSIPTVIDAPPGIRPVSQLPAARAWLGGLSAAIGTGAYS